MPLFSPQGRLLLFAVTTLVALAAVGQASPALADQIQGGRGAVVEKIRNDHAPFGVRVSVDHASGRYTIGDEMKVTVRSERDGYLYLLYVDADENVSCLFPNKIQSDNAIRAGSDVTVPASSSGFRLRIAPPAGTETLKAIVTLEPLQAVQHDKLVTADVTALTAEDLKGVQVESTGRRDWAEHDVTITTTAVGTAQQQQQSQQQSQSGQQSQAQNTRRVGVFIGLSTYADPAINQLHVCHVDAQEMAKVMKEKCRLDAAEVLVNEHATRAAIEKAIRRTLPAASRPGDTVFIFWSGHGARIADDNGDEQDGFDEMLIPHDIRTDDIDTVRRTAVIDDTFARWLQDLDGRKVVLILDTCHSGGAAKGAKGVTAPLLSPPAPANGGFDFLEREMARAKDLGQRELAMLSASQASQISLERRERDMSAMTYFLVRKLRESGGPVTLKDGFEAVRDAVTRYAAEQGVEQNPTLIDNTTPPVYLRP